MKIYGLTTCRTTQKALAWFKLHGISNDFQNFKKTGVAKEKLQEWDWKQGYEVFLNKKGLTWKKLDPEIKAGINNSEMALALLQQQPGIIKRPVIEDGDFLFFGFDEKVYEDHFLSLT
ncbi:ArsC/Spx/MgsR family protein [Mucilaginibacter gynuensis]